MGKCEDDRCVFPLTSLQIGDLQSYLSDLRLFVAVESKKLYILVDNRPWLRELGSRPAHLWQLMVTKSRLSPFANSKAQRGRKRGKETSSLPQPSKGEKIKRWFSLVDAVTSPQKRVLLPVKTLQKSLILSSELQRTLYGFIVFEVTWSAVRGINYLNELQTDTSLAIEAKTMQRWEFDSIAQAASCISLWFSGTPSEQLQLKYFLDSVTGEVFYDAEEDFARAVSIDDEEDSSPDNLWSEASSSHCLNGFFDLTPGMVQTNTSEPQTPPPTGPYKRRRVNKPIGTGFEVNFCSEEMQSGTPDSLYNSETCTSDSESSVEAKQYQDVLILFRFNDHDLPFKMRQIIMSDLRLLTLLEAGLPSWVIFLQSYPVFCHLYRPWMCPLARALYVLISVVTVLIGFYDLYKNVPLLKATASRLCGPLFDWIESWEMVSRIKYLGTMLFLHNFEKAVTWCLTLMHTTRSFFSVFAQPLVEPVMEILGFVVPVWNMFVEVAENLCSVVWVVIGSTFSTVGYLIEVILWPMWFVISIIWNTASSILYPIFFVAWEILYAPVRLILALASFVTVFCAWMLELIGDIWRSTSTIFQFASTSEATVSTYQVSMWRSLWNDLFSQPATGIALAFIITCTTYSKGYTVKGRYHKLQILEMIKQQLGLNDCLRQKGIFPSDKTHVRGCTKGYPGYRSLFPGGNCNLQQVSKRNLQNPKKKKKKEKKEKERERERER